ncbi:histone deacetylase family protein [Sphingomonas canadensis]|uniref:Histone deacetylase family protein n=1 Tax=Sphingomonas canadensis TaxID=1219257 RepID=A0ABW3H7H5_9SPHN|nr:histone deacetylase family protein [Sphingomonas canadensis]MCW3836574.1 histone deacetylase family protein [Sphingomonas canadensis]
MLSVFDPRQLSHLPAREMHNGGWSDHAETADRARIVAARLGGLAAARDFGMAPIARVHGADYLDFLRGAHARWREAGRDGDAIGYAWPVVGRRPLVLSRIDALLGRFSFDAVTPIGPGTWNGAYWSAQTALTALAPLLAGDARAAFALCRPPGHHAGADYCGGYCYLNNAAIAARAAQDAGVARVAILDVDYHHGNGTQDLFLEDGTVFFASIHADPAADYPYYWGHADERGQGAGEGATLNLPLPRGTGIDGYLPALDRTLDAIAGFAPGLLLVSFGADTFAQDPISHFAIRTGDYPRLGARIAALGLPALVVMEGGYAVDALGENVAAFLSGF